MRLSLASIFGTALTWLTIFSSPARAEPFNVYYRSAAANPWLFYSTAATKAAADQEATELRDTGFLTEVVASTTSPAIPTTAAVGGGPGYVGGAHYNRNWNWSSPGGANWNWSWNDHTNHHYDASHSDWRHDHHQHPTPAPHPHPQPHPTPHPTPHHHPHDVHQHTQHHAQHHAHQSGGHRK